MKPILAFALIFLTFLVSAQFARHVTAHRFRATRSTSAPSALAPSLPLLAPTIPATWRPHPRQERETTQGAPEVAVQVTGDANTITFRASEFVNPETRYHLDGDNGTSVFPVGPHQTARIDLQGDANTVRVAAELKERVTVVNNGDGNSVVD